MVVRPVKFKKTMLTTINIKLRLIVTTSRIDFVLKSSITTMMSMKKGMRMSETSMADSD